MNSPRPSHSLKKIVQNIFVARKAIINFVFHLTPDGHIVLMVVYHKMRGELYALPLFCL